MDAGGWIRRARQREFLGAALSVIVIVVAVIFLVGPGGTKDASFVAIPGGGTRLRVGEAAPNFRLPLLGGGEFELASLKGRPVWINVWASWCPPCRAEMPDIDQIRRSAEERGLAFLAVNYLEDIAAAQSYLSNTDYDFQVALDSDGGFANLYRVLGLPSHIFINAEGVLEEVRVGSMTRDEMVSRTDSLTQGRPLVSAPAADTTEPLASGDPRVGEALYNLQCLQCHGGPQGDVRVQAAPPHNGAGHTWHHADGQLMEIILKGSKVVGIMPPFEGTLSEQEITSILAYIKTWWSPEQRASQEEASRNWDASH